MICKPCKDSRNIQGYNNSPKHHKDLMKHQHDMSYLTKQLKNYFDKINYQYNDLIELETKLIHFAKSNQNYIKVKNVDIKYKVYNSWLNFMRECISRTYLSKQESTYVYFAKSKENIREYKIGITTNPNRRYGKNDRYYDLQIIRKFDNRYQAAYVEYKLRTLFCNGVNNEIINEKVLDNVIKYVKNIKYNNKTKNELKVLGFTNIQ